MRLSQGLRHLRLAGVLGLSLYALGSISSGTAVPVAAAPAGAGTLVLSPDGTSIAMTSAMLMKFDLSTLPAGAVVKEASLVALLDNGTRTGDTDTITARKVIGGDFDAVRAQSSLSLPYDTQTIDQTPGLASWTLTRMVQEWLADPATNFGLLLNTSAALQPVLRLDYVIPQRQQILTPHERQEVNGLVLKFDLSTLPAGAVIHEAALRMALVDSDSTADGAYTVEARKVIGTDPGVDLTAGYRTASPAYDTRAIDQSRGYKVWTLTDMVQEWIADPATNFGVLLNTDASTPGGHYRSFGSTNNVDDALRPALVVWYSLASNTQKVAPREDTYLNLDKNSHGTDTKLNTYTWPNKKIANVILMQFDLSSLPKGAVIEEALLHLALVESDAEVEKTYTVTAHKLRKQASLTAATGYTSDGSTAWTANNCCNGGAPMAQADISGAYDTRAIDKAQGDKVWTLTKMVQEWVADPATNFGVLLNSDTSKPKDRWRFFASKEASDSNLRPYLSIAYSLPTDTTPPVISGVASSGVSVSGATIRWTTDEASDSQVQYGATTAYGSTTTVDSNRVTSHTVTIGGLSEAKQYNYRVVSRDAAGNAATSANFTFTTPDATAPAVSITAPAAGTTVSATITVSASASDSVGVAGVQFRLDGASLGAEDTAAPYSVSWNTTTTSAGSHTLSAVARDAAGNSRTSAAVTVTVSNVSPPPPPPPPTGTLSALYPGDVGIESHPDVILVDRFEDSAVSAVLPRWTDVLNGSTMSLAADVPPGSPGSKSLDIPWVGGGVSNGGHLYKQLAGIDGSVYVRYYIKYPTSGTYNHTGIWMGGANPATPWPNPQAGTKPAGNDRFIAAAEQNYQTAGFDHYDYWMGMRQSTDGNYWGNLLLNDPDVQGSRGQWMCVEHMVKLNDPASSNGEHAIWLDGEKVSHLGPGFPNGSWSGGIFTQSSTGSPFPGFRWRSDSALKLNWIWLQVYAPNDPAGFRSSVKFDHVVVAKSHIGCLTAATSGGDAIAPTVSLTAPAGGATISGTTTVSASASDNVGVAGVQFKLDGANLGAEDTTAPYSVSWSTTTATAGVHTLAAVARDAAGNKTTAVSVTVTVSGVGSTTWPNEPAGLTLLNDQPWDLMTGLSWNYLRRSSSKDDSIVADSAAPFSPANNLRIVFTPSMARDSEPSVHWLSVPGIKEVYTAWWMKLSPNWECSPAGCGKVTFLFTNGAGQVYTGVYHSAGSTSAPYRIAVNTEWAPYGQQIWYPNATTTPVNPGQWHRVEVYYRWETTPGGSSDGIIRFWVDGVLNGNYTNVHYPASSFVEFQFAPTLQNPPSAEQYMFIDHTRVSRK